METKERYVQFPLFLLREMLLNKKDTINKIISFGLYKYSTKFNYTVDDASKNLMYYFYRKKRELTSYLSETIDTYIESEILDLDEDYNGFNDKEFEPTFEMEQLDKIYKTDAEFLNRVIEFYQMQLAFNSIGINGSIELCLNTAKKIEKQIEPNEPQPMVNTNLLFDFRENEKSESDLIQFLAYIAIKSILGKNLCTKTNKNHILSRMFGYSSIKHLPDKLKPSINELRTKYSHRHHFTQLIKKLEMNWQIITYSNHIRGMYVAMKYKISIDELALKAETKKEKVKIEALKQLKKEAKEKALEQIKKNTLNKGN
jgi:hypothetical protein